jgi:hypothetical protein
LEEKSFIILKPDEVEQSRFPVPFSSFEPELKIGPFFNRTLAYFALKTTKLIKGARL